jgi:hypothetical protein
MKGLEIGKEELKQEDRSKCLQFNIKEYWHCWYDPKTNKMYNQFGKKTMNNAYDYLLLNGFINKEKEFLKYADY